jgi:uracil-DNA glycosylase family 4
MLSPDHLTQSNERALKALIAWWADAGIELDAPIVRPRAERAAAAPAKTQAAHSREPVYDGPAPRAATAAAAKAAGFGDSAGSGPSAREAAAKADDIEALRKIIEDFEGCTLKRTARNTVFSRGNPAAKIMIVGEAPGRDEDERGIPFVGRSGQLLDKMFASIGLGEDDLYISNIVNWRPPGNRNPTQEEVAVCLPLIERHIALAKPDVLILTGGVAAQSLLRAEAGITKLRGKWTEYAVKDAGGEASDNNISCLPIFHPSYLLRQPAHKRLAWADLLALKAHMSEIAAE